MPDNPFDEFFRALNDAVKPTQEQITAACDDLSIVLWCQWESLVRHGFTADQAFELTKLALMKNK